MSSFGPRGTLPLGTRRLRASSDGFLLVGCRGSQRSLLFQQCQLPLQKASGEIPCSSRRRSQCHFPLQDTRSFRLALGELLFSCLPCWAPVMRRWWPVVYGWCCRSRVVVVVFWRSPVDGGALVSPSLVSLLVVRASELEPVCCCRVEAVKASEFGIPC